MANGIKFLTYNVYSGENLKDFKIRRRYAIETILDYDPDVICLQESSENFVKDFLKKTKSYKICQKKDFISKDQYEEIKNSGFICILYKKEYKLLSSELIYKGGWFDDGIIKVKLMINDLEVSFYNVHLSGGSFDKPVQVTLEKRIRRVLELNTLVNDLLSENRYIVGGDFNSDANSKILFPEKAYSLDDGEDIFPEVLFYPSNQIKGVSDAWLELKPHEPGYTEDYLLNDFRNSLKPGQNRLARFDQIYYKKRKNIKASHIELIGVDSFSYKKDVLFPSDHFGLFCIFDTY
jgi:endonuclease/exonuclease/phosphatase family metal-dependent hydrolase